MKAGVGIAAGKCGEPKRPNQRLGAGLQNENGKLVMESLG